MPTASGAAIQSIRGQTPAQSWLEPSRLVVVATLLFVIVFFGLIRYRLRDVPLERDEGEYAYSGQLMLQGIPPYQLAYNMKLPGIYAAYAGLMKVLGETPSGIHLALLLLNALTILVMYLLTARLFGSLAGLIAAASYALLSASSSVMGFKAHATNFVVLPALLGILFLLHGLDSRRDWILFASGLCGGIAVLMKQHGAFFVLFCMLYLLFTLRHYRWAWRSIVRSEGIYLAGVLLLYALTCAWLYRAGVFHQFWFWTVSYAGEYSKMGFRRAVRAFLENSGGVIAPATLIWVLAALGFSAIWWSESARRHSRFLRWLLLCSFLSLCPGAFFRPHYYILILPAVAMLVGVGIAGATERMAEHHAVAKLVPLLIFAACFGASIFMQRQDYFIRAPLAVFESSYPDDPFVAAQQVAAFIRQNSAPSDRIAVIGSEPEIYFYAHRHSATGYLYMYSLIVRQKYTDFMRDQFMQELETSRPKYLIYVDVWNSWGERESPQTAPFIARLQKFMDNGYERVGVADLRPDTLYVWGRAAQTYVPQSISAIFVLRRTRSGPPH